MKARIITAPAHWADALVFEDYSGLPIEDAVCCLEWTGRVLQDGETICATVDDIPRTIDGQTVLDFIVAAPLKLATASS